MPAAPVVDGDAEQLTPPLIGEVAAVGAKSGSPVGGKGHRGNKPAREGSVGKRNKSPGGFGGKGHSGKEGVGGKGHNGKEGSGGKGHSGKDGAGVKGHDGKEGVGRKGHSGKEGFGGKGDSGKKGHKGKWQSGKGHGEKGDRIHGHELKGKLISAEDPLLDGRRVRGFVRHYCPLKGTGFAKCEEHKLEVVLDREESENCGLSAGATVSFAIMRGEDGRPHAREVRVLLRGNMLKERVTRLKGVEIDWSKTYMGVIKVIWFGGKDSIFSVPSMQKKDTGGAFVGSEEAFKTFGCDIWAYPTRIPGAKVGDVLMFRVEIDYFWSYPVAVDIHRVEGMVEDIAKPAEAICAATAGALLDKVGQTQLASPSGATPSAANRKTSNSRKANKQPKAELSADAAPVEASDLAPGATSCIDDSLDEGTDACNADLSVEGDGSVHNLLASVPTPNRRSAGQDEGIVASSEISSVQAEAVQQAWQRYKLDDGDGFWWWCEVDDDYFLEDNPGPWTKYMDPDTGKSYWWQNEEKWFWI